MNVNLHIERLILEGVTLSPRERTLLGASLEAELTRLITTAGLPGGLSGGAVPFLPADSIDLPDGQAPAQLGTQIAQSVYQVMGKV